MDHKASVKKAIENFINSQEPKETTHRKNKKPEKITESECVAWMRDNGFDVNVIESKAVFNPVIGRYLNSNAKPGHADCSGNDRNGYAVYVEFKAKGRIRTLRPKQRKFLIDKINTQCFGVVVDSHLLLQEYYENWLKLKVNPEEARKYLLSILPKEKLSVDDDKLFED